jgi:hypothetical protein
MMRKLETVQSSLREKPQLWVVDSPQTPHVNSHNQDKNILEESCGNVEDLILLNLSSNFLGAKPICNLEPAHRYKEQSNPLKNALLDFTTHSNWHLTMLEVSCFFLETKMHTLVDLNLNTG